MSVRKLGLAATLLVLAASAAPSAMIMSPRMEAPTENDPTKLIGELQTAFNEFKKTTDASVAAKADGKGVAELTEKQVKINASIDAIEDRLKAIANEQAAREVGNNGGEPKVANVAGTKAFNQFFRRGEDLVETRNDLKRSVDSEGGFLAPVEWDRSIQDQLVEISEIRQICKVETVSGAGKNKLVNLKGTTGGWVNETDARPQTDTAAFANLAIGWGEVYAMPAATETMLEDAEINLEAWLAGEVSEVFMEMENSAFVAGDGVNKPRGFLTYVTGGANAARHPLGAVETIASGAAAGLTTDAFINLTYAPAKKYRNNARWAMNRSSLSEVRKLTDTEGNYIWQPTFALGQPSTLNGYAVSEIEDMPDLAANAYPIAFGDFKAGYSIFDRKGVSVLRDPYTAKPYVLFYTRKRVGGAVTDPHAIKAMQIKL